MNEIKLHLGCGKRYLPGYINIDISSPTADIHIDVKKLPYPDEYIDEIYACHILEHFGRHEYLSVLGEWARVLKKGKRIYLAVPDLEASFEYYNKHKDITPLIGQFYGGQKDEFDYHKIGFTFDSMSNALRGIGFDTIERYNSFEYLPKDFDDYSLSYLPHMDFKNGYHLSLNITGVKK